VKITVVDLSTWDLRGTASQRTRTREGFLSAPALISTADNVQPYRARELGLTDGDPDRVVRLFRPRAEVFSKDTLASFERATLTVTHPTKGVDSKEWKRVAAGDVHEVRPAGDTTAAVLLIRDQTAIDVVEKEGTVQLSCGYDFDLDMTPGTFNGQAYDGIQRGITGNHVAIVDAARGGPALRIADRNPTQPTKETSMRITVKDKKIGDITVPGFSFTVAENEVTNVQDAYDRHMTGLQDCYMAHDAMTKSRNMEKERADAAEGKLSTAEAAKRATDAALDEAKKKLDGIPALVELAAIERTSVVGDAMILVKDFDSKGKTVPAIRLEVLGAIMANDEELKPIVTAGLGAVALDKAPAEVVTATFSTTAAIAKRLRGTGDASANDADVRARDAALAGGGSAGAGETSTSAPQKAGKPPRFTGMDAVTEANRLHRLGKVAEAEAVLEEARQ
jgi:hypothetical protein